MPTHTHTHTHTTHTHNTHTHTHFWLLPTQNFEPHCTLPPIMMHHMQASCWTTCCKHRTGGSLPPQVTFTKRERKITISSLEFYCFPPADNTLRGWNAAVFVHKSQKQLAVCKSEVWYIRNKLWWPKLFRSSSGWIPEKQEECVQDRGTFRCFPLHRHQCARLTPQTAGRDPEEVRNEQKAWHTDLWEHPNMDITVWQLRQENEWSENDSRMKEWWVTETDPCSFGGGMSVKDRE